MRCPTQRLLYYLQGFSTNGTRCFRRLRCRPDPLARHQSPIVLLSPRHTRSSGGRVKEPRGASSRSCEGGAGVRIGASILLTLRIERVAQAVTQEGESQHRQANGQNWKKKHVRICLDV